MALLEESLQLLRTGGADILLFYWTGSLPFAVALLWLLRDCRELWGEPLLVRDSMFCAFAFIWLGYWRSIASCKTLSLLVPSETVETDWPKRLAFQTIFQAMKLVLMPLAVASLIAWPGASAFFRTLALEPQFQERGIRDAVRNAFSAAGDRYIENAVVFLTVALLAGVLCLNILVVFAVLPTLWKIFTGYETDWSRLENPSGIFSLFSIASVATWFLIDPWLQTFAVLRVFYRNARSDGRDLLRELSRVTATVLLLMLCVGPLRAEQISSREQAMNRAIDQAAKEMDYGWLHPPAQSSPKGFLGVVAKTVHDLYGSIRDHVKTWYRSFSNWLRDLIRDRKLTREDLRSPKPKTQELRWMLAFLAAVICGLILALFLRTGRMATVRMEAGASVAPVADVLDDQLLASEVRQEEWLRLALDHLAQNQTRLASRAFYLANLSWLGTEKMLSLALWKSNRLYERELARQPRSAALTAAFAVSNRLYERAWFGMRELSPEQMGTLKAAAEQLRSNV